VTENDYAGVRDLPNVDVTMRSHVRRQGTQWVIDANLRNTSKAPALLVRVKAVREKTGDLIVPALYDDNYIALMPGERRTIHIQMENADTRGERPRVVLYGFNLKGSGHTWARAVTASGIEQPGAQE